MALDNSIHKNILIQILKDIYSDMSIGPILGFKGGAAAYFFYHLGRFSLDLDFDLLDETKIDHIFDHLKKIASFYGKLKDSRKKRNTIFLLLSYEEKAPNIKIEVNTRDFGSKYEVKPYLGISMKVMAREDMFANKLAAMMERMGKTNRDIFDVWFFLKNNWPINASIVEKRTELPLKAFLQKCIVSLEKIGDRHILSGIGELLDADQKKWVKNNLRKDAIFLLKARIESMR